MIKKKLLPLIFTISLTIPFFSNATRTVKKGIGYRQKINNNKRARSPRNNYLTKKIKRKMLADLKKIK